MVVTRTLLGAPGLTTSNKDATRNKVRCSFFAMMFFEDYRWDGRSFSEQLGASLSKYVKSWRCQEPFSHRERERERDSCAILLVEFRDDALFHIGPSCGAWQLLSWAPAAITWPQSRWWQRVLSLWLVIPVQLLLWSRMFSFPDSVCGLGDCTGPYWHGLEFSLSLSLSLFCTCLAATNHVSRQWTISSGIWRTTELLASLRMGNVLRPIWFHDTLCCIWYPWRHTVVHDSSCYSCTIRLEALLTFLVRQ